MADLATHLAISFAVGSALDLSPADMAYFLSSNLIDLDHILADPIYDPNRSSFVHPLHKNWPIVGLTGGAVNIWLGVGILMHVYIDYLDDSNLKK